VGLFYFDLATLQTLDNGRPATAFRRAVEDAANDMIDRPKEERPRKVLLELTLVPIAKEDPNVNGKFIACGSTAEITIKSSIPNRRTRPYNFGMDRNGRLFFSEESPTNVAQTTFDDLNPETGHVDRGEIHDVKDVE
jgi:hypothetical protein